MGTFLFFLYLYYSELSREHTLIKYLEINVHKPRDNDSVGKELEHLKEHDLKAIRNNRINYDNSAKIASVMFLINTICSGLNLYNYQLESKTFTVFLTNVLFTATKLGNAYAIVNSDTNIFLSAYMTRRVQFNDIDPNVYEIKEEDEKVEKNQKENGIDISSINIKDSSEQV